MKIINLNDLLMNWSEKPIFLIIPTNTEVPEAEDILMANSILENITDKDSSRKFCVFIDSPSKEQMKSLLSSLENEHGYIMYPPANVGDFLLTTGYKTIRANQIVATLKDIRKTVNQYSCYLTEWSLSSK